MKHYTFYSRRLSLRHLHCGAGQRLADPRANGNNVRRLCCPLFPGSRLSHLRVDRSDAFIHVVHIADRMYIGHLLRVGFRDRIVEKDRHMSILCRPGALAGKGLGIDQNSDRPQVLPCRHHHAIDFHGLICDLGAQAVQLVRLCAV